MGEDVERVVMADGSIRLASATDGCVIKRLRPGHVLFAVYGIESTGVRARVMEEMEREKTAADSMCIYGDMREASRIDAAGREAWGAFAKRHGPTTTRVVMLVRSKLVEMAVSLVGLFAGGGKLHTVSNERAFINEIARDVPGFTALPEAFRAPRKTG